MTSTDHSPAAAATPNFSHPPVALIAGPTASGKSAIALRLAHALAGAGRDAVIINADASQVYAAIPILSAQPSAAEQAAVPHRLYGHIDGAQAYNAAAWAAEATAEIDGAHRDSAIPILVGGSGLYISTLIDGIAPVPDIDPGLRARVRGLGVAAAHAELLIADPAAAARLSPNDTTRVARALEVALATGRTLADWQQQRVGGIGVRINLAPAILLPPRDWLRDRCDARFAAMLGTGALDEVTALLDRSLDPALPAMRAIGVAELRAHMAGEISLAQAATLATAATRQYAKRQYNWFRHQPPVAWPRHIEQLNDDNINEIVIKLRNMVLTG
jgi:tRNA dimethylallyltransferase